MNWDAIGALGEVVGAGAVVITLVFLIIEMRASRRVAQTASVDLLSDGWNRLNAVLMADQELTTLLFTGMNDPTKLTGEQKLRMQVTLQSYVNHFMTVKKHYEAGHLPEEEWQHHSMGIAHMMNSPGGREALKIVAVTPSVRELLESYRNTNHEDGYLGVTAKKGPPPENSVETDT